MGSFRSVDDAGGILNRLGATWHGYSVCRLLRLRLHFRAMKLKLIGNWCRDGEALSAVQPVRSTARELRDPFRSEFELHLDRYHVRLGEPAWT